SHCCAGTGVTYSPSMLLSRQAVARCRSRLWLLYWVSTQIRRTPPLTRLDNAKSTTRYTPPNGTAALARSAVNGAHPFSHPPAPHTPPHPLPPPHPPKPCPEPSYQPLSAPCHRAKRGSPTPDDAQPLRPAPHRPIIGQRCQPDKGERRGPLPGYASAGGR